MGSEKFEVKNEFKEKLDGRLENSNDKEERNEEWKEIKETLEEKVEQSKNKGNKKEWSINKTMENKREQINSNH